MCYVGERGGEIIDLASSTHISRCRLHTRPKTSVSSGHNSRFANRTGRTASHKPHWLIVVFTMLRSTWTVSALTLWKYFHLPVTVLARLGQHTGVWMYQFGATVPSQLAVVFCGLMHILVACEDENSDGKLASGDGFRAGVAQAAGTTKNRETIALANDIAIRRRLIMRGGCYSNPNGLALVRAARRP